MSDYFENPLAERNHHECKYCSPSTNSHDQCPSDRLAEIAEKIVVDLHKLQYPDILAIVWNERGLVAINIVLEALRTVKKEAYAEGFNAAREQAAAYLEYKASIIRGDYNGPDILNQTAHEIRYMAPGDK